MSEISPDGSAGQVLKDVVSLRSDSLSLSMGSHWFKYVRGMIKLAF